MKTVVITGSARGFGLEMAKEFRKYNYNVVISDILDDELAKAESLLKSISGNGSVLSVRCDVTREEDLTFLKDETVKNFGSIDIWINNAGVNQKMVPIWEVNTKDIDKLIDIDLKGSIIGSKIAMNQMIKQGFGQIYGIEGYGSDDAMMTGLSIYGTSKRGLTYFLESLAKEVDDKKLNIQIGLLAPGIMITDFVNHSMGTDGFELSEKVKKVYNILGDKPDVIAEFLVKKIVKNNKNGVRFTWLTGSKAMWRFMTSGSRKNRFFK